jgi:hypothetical protein
MIFHHVPSYSIIFRPYAIFHQELGMWWHENCKNFHRYVHSCFIPTSQLGYGSVHLVNWTSKSVSTLNAVSKSPSPIFFGFHIKKYQFPSKLPLVAGLPPLLLGQTKKNIYLCIYIYMCILHIYICYIYIYIYVTYFSKPYPALRFITRMQGVGVAKEHCEAKTLGWWLHYKHMSHHEMIRYNLFGNNGQ